MSPCTDVVPVHRYFGILKRKHKNMNFFLQCKEGGVQNTNLKTTVIAERIQELLTSILTDELGHRCWIRIQDLHTKLKSLRSRS